MSLEEVSGALMQLLDISIEELEVITEPTPDSDLVISADGQTFSVDWLGTSEAGPIALHAERSAIEARDHLETVIPLLAVPFMSEVGRRACEAASLSWFDLSGNGHITGPGLRVIVDGRPNRFKRPGRPASIFAPKSARVVRWLLMHQERAFTQREIAHATQMTEGYVSRIVGRLEADSYVVRVDVSGEGDGLGGGYGYGTGTGSGNYDGTGDSRKTRLPVRIRDASLLLDAWREAYEFGKHTILKGHVASRSGEALSRTVSEALMAVGLDHAATGLTAAWQMTHFASFRIATFFTATEPSRELLGRLGFREEPRGANLWLITPNDSGVFQGAEPRDGIRCVHPVQAYLDLKDHPERAAEAADRLRSDLLDGKLDA